jgi:HAD superfamily hydrolase (TIGR01509 family)
VTITVPLAGPIQAVLFDCDGVLADSEGLVNRIVAAELTALGWPMDGAEAHRRFLGLAWPDMRPILAARLGPLPPGWEERLGARILQALEHELTPIPGAAAALAAVAARGLPMAVCSNSSRAELRMKLARLGFTQHFAGRIFCFEDVERPKPAPDMYLAAAAACGVPAAQCLVIEDSDPGAVAGLAAGCRLLRVEGEVPDLVPWLAPRAA